MHLVRFRCRWRQQHPPANHDARSPSSQTLLPSLPAENDPTKTRIALVGSGKTATTHQQRRLPQPRSPICHDFITLRIGDVKHIVEAVTEQNVYYRSIRTNVENAAYQWPAVRSVCQRLKELLPEAVFPDVCFLIGRLNCGGTVVKSGIIGLEMFVYSPGTPTDACWSRRTADSPNGTTASVPERPLPTSPR